MVWASKHVVGEGLISKQTGSWENFQFYGTSSVVGQYCASESRPRSLNTCIVDIRCKDRVILGYISFLLFDFRV